MHDHDLSSAEARLLVLEMSVAALIAQQPPQSLEEVASMLCFVAGVTEETEEIASSTGERQLGHVRHWASEMLHRVMVSRKPSRADT
jgi:hypothetical protein